MPKQERTRHNARVGRPIHVGRCEDDVKQRFRGRHDPDPTWILHLPPELMRTSRNQNLTGSSQDRPDHNGTEASIAKSGHGIPSMRPRPFFISRQLLRPTLTAGDHVRRGWARLLYGHGHLKGTQKKESSQALALKMTAATSTPDSINSECAAGCLHKLFSKKQNFSEAQACFCFRCEKNLTTWSHISCQQTEKE